MLPPLAPARRLTSEQRADCVVLGAGFTGLAAARQLATHRPDWHVALVEAQRVGFGASGRNSGFIVDVGHYEPRRGVEGNRRLVRLGRAGLDRLRALVHTHAIECAWTERGRLHGAVGDLGMRLLDEFYAGLRAMGEPHEALLHDGCRDVRTVGVHVQCARTRDDHEVHVFHRNRPDQHLVSYDQGSGESHPVAKADLDRTDVGDELSAIVSERRLLLVDLV